MPFLSRAGICCAILMAAFALPACAQDEVFTTGMEVVHGKPYVKVMVNGKGPFRFVVDTGTGGDALITPALAQQLDLPVVGESRLIDPSGQGERRAPIVLIDSLNVAGKEFHAVRAIRHTLGAEDGTCQGLLGFLLFRNFLLTMDYPHNRLTLSHGALKPDGEKSVLPFRMPQGVPIVTLHIGGNEVDAQMDSGGVGLSLPERLAYRLKFSVDPKLFAISESLSTRFQVMAGKLAEDVHLGRYSYRRPIVEVNSAFPLANLGGYALHFFTITFDQNTGLVRLESKEKTFRLDTLPVALQLQNTLPSKPPDKALVPLG